jgi:DNA-binding transcriptional LysR family regulator
VGDIEQTMRRLREEFAGAQKEVRVGVSRTIGLAYLPGFFHANLRKQPMTGCRVKYDLSTNILAGLESSDLDLGVVCPPPRLPGTLTVTHRFQDAFTLIAPASAGSTFPKTAKSRQALRDWLNQQNWLLIEEGSNTGRGLRAWMKQQGLAIEPKMQLDSFDLIINLVALGMGASFVPIRALALYPCKRTLHRLPMAERFVRELVVVTRAHGKVAEHVNQFVANVLF